MGHVAMGGDEVDGAASPERLKAYAVASWGVKVSCESHYLASEDHLVSWVVVQEVVGGTGGGHLVCGVAYCEKDEEVVAQPLEGIFAFVEKDATVDTVGLPKAFVGSQAHDTGCLVPQETVAEIVAVAAFELGSEDAACAVD